MKVLEFPRVKQLFDYDCGAKALEAIFLYYHLNESYKKIIKIAGTDKDGTKVKGIEKALRFFNFDFKSKRMSVSELKGYLKKKVPVIILLQAWPEQKISNWKDFWESGHYVVAIGFDKEKIYFEDPWCKQTAFLTSKELSERWHDSVRGQKYRNHGIAVFGLKESLLNAAIHMD